MSMIELSEESLEEFRLCDASLTGVAWLEAGRDFQFQMLLGSGEPATLTCHWASEVHIDLRFDPNHAGMPLSFECRLERQNDQWRMAFDFPPQGLVRLLCNDATLERSSSK
jgi:hypothetical protein